MGHPGRDFGRILLVLLLGLFGLASCGSDSDETVLTWYINPDPPPPDGFSGPFGLRGIADRCNAEADGYRIAIEELPGDASQQRIQLARRLAADDPAIDLMSLDPVFTGEFAAADFLAPLPPDLQETLSEDVLDGALASAEWEGELVVAPQWANTQVLWFRKSVAEAAGLDMSGPVTWDDLITAASDQGATVGVQANKYEGYAVLINALVLGAGGEIVAEAEEGADAEIAVDSAAGAEAAAVLDDLSSSAAAQPDLSVSNEGTVLPYMWNDEGSFMVNWTFVYATYQGMVSNGEITEGDFADLGWARYPRTVSGEESRPPLGGINLGVNAASDDVDAALDALDCLTSPDNQVTYAIETGNMPADAVAYEDSRLTDALPADLLDLFAESVAAAGPRPVTPYWTDISSGVQSTWHPPASVGPSTPERSAEFLRAVLAGEALL